MSVYRKDYAKLHILTSAANGKKTAAEHSDYYTQLAPIRQQAK
jgi:hypothetical protein